MAVPSLGSDVELTLNKLAIRVYDNAKAHGFWEGEGCSAGEKIALMHQELSELFDNYRDRESPPSSKIPPYTNAEEEAADLIIRVLDFCVHNNLNVAGAIIAKHEYNVNRPYKHGRGNF